MKAMIRFIHDDRMYGEFRMDDKGIIDGYILGPNNTPCAVIFNQRTKGTMVTPLSVIQIEKYVDIEDANELIYSR